MSPALVCAICGLEMQEVGDYVSRGDWIIEAEDRLLGMQVGSMHPNDVALVPLEKALSRLDAAEAPQ